MTPLCNIEVTLPRVLGSREVRRGGGVDEQAGVQPSIIVGNDEFAPAEALLNYITRAPSGDGLLLVEVPFAAEARAAQPVSVIFDAPAGDAYAGHRIARLDWALEVRNDAFSICFPRPVRV